MSSADVSVCAAAEADLPAVQSLLREAWHDTYGPLLGRDRVAEITGRWHAMDALAAQLRWPGNAFLIARSKDGLVAGHGLSSAAESSTVLEIVRLYVRPGWQGRGIGRRLLQALVDRPAIDRVTLSVAAGNRAGLRFWRREGFEVQSETTGEGLTWFVMTRPGI